MFVTRTFSTSRAPQQMQADDCIDSMDHTSRSKVCMLVILIWMAWNAHPVVAVIDRVDPLDRPARIVIVNLLGENVHVVCSGWPQVLDHNDRVIQRTLGHQHEWRIDYGRDLFQERLSCEFQNFERLWNCFSAFAVPLMCVWENPQLAVARGGIASPEGCPVCDLRNAEGEIVCMWRIENRGALLLRWDNFRKEEVLERKGAWQEMVAPFAQAIQDPETVFYISFTNRLETPVTLDCGVRGTFDIRGFRAALGAMEWEREVNVVEEAASNGGDPSWICDVVMEDSDGTRWSRSGIRLWDTPLGFDPDDNDREPPCIDCAWELRDGGLWVDRRDCDDDEHDRSQWDKRYTFPR